MLDRHTITTSAPPTTHGHWHPPSAASSKLAHVEVPAPPCAPTSQKCSSHSILG